MISLGYYCSTHHFFTTYCFNCACVDRTTPTYCKILPIILGIILNSFVHLLFSKSGIIYLALDVSRDPKDLYFLVFQVNKLYRILLAYDRSNDDVLEALGISLRLLEEENDMPLCMGGYTPQYLFSGGRGRPRLSIDIRQEQLEYLLHLGFTCPQIAMLMEVSLSTEGCQSMGYVSLLCTQQSLTKS